MVPRGSAVWVGRHLYRAVVFESRYKVIFWSPSLVRNGLIRAELSPVVNVRRPTNRKTNVPIDHTHFGMSIDESVTFSEAVEYS